MKALVRPIYTVMHIAKNMEENMWFIFSIFI